MPRAGTTKSVTFSTFKHPRPAPAPPPSHPQAAPETTVSSRKRIRFARSEASLLHAHGISLEGGELTYDSNAVFRPILETTSASSSNLISAAAETKANLMKKVRCCGYIGLQKGRLRSWSWTRKRWVVVLSEGYYLCAAPKEDAEYTDTLPLDKVHQLHRVESKRFCCAISTPTETWYLIFNDEPTLDHWMAHLLAHCPLLNIGPPTQIKHLLHVTYDNVAMQIKGLPVPWIESMGLLGASEREVDVDDGGQVQTPLTEPSRSPVSPTSMSSTSAPSINRPQMTARSMPVVPIVVRSPLQTRAPPLPPTAPDASTSQLSSSATSSSSRLNTHNSSRRRDTTFFDLEARDLTGCVEAVHLLPVARGENCDTWKGKWTGKFGTRQVAIHTIRFSREITDSALIEKFSSILLRELKALHQLRHPNVVRIRGYTRDLNSNNTSTTTTMATNGVPALISTWIPGGNLMEYLDYARPVSVGLRLKFLAEAAAGLHYLHNFPYPLLHGSFRGCHIQIQTPTPLISSAPKTTHARTQVQQYPTALITNFGLTPLFADEDCRWLLPEPVPSPRWAAPEVLLSRGGGGGNGGYGRKETTAKSDVFSFARTVVEVLTSHHPFPAIPSDAQVLRLVTDESEYIHHKRDLVAGLPPSHLPPTNFISRSRSNSHSYSHSHSRSHSHNNSTVPGSTTSTGLENRKLWSLLERCWNFDPALRPDMGVVALKMAEIAREYEV